MNTALSNVTVLDLSRILAGPWAGQVLADPARMSSRSKSPTEATIPAHGDRPFCSTPMAGKNP